jgi:hypothetical protein
MAFDLVGRSCQHRKCNDATVTPICMAWLVRLLPTGAFAGGELHPLESVALSRAHPPRPPPQR